MKVIVVGGGTSGLAATYKLKQMGVDVTTFEARDFPGGRIAGVRKGGYVFDIGAQFIMKFYDATRELCRELGIEDEIVQFPFRVGLSRNGKIYPASASVNPIELWKNRNELLRFRGLPPLAMLQLAKMGPVFLKRLKDLHFINFEKMLDLDDVSLAEFTSKHGGKAALEYMFQPVASCLTLGEPEDLGAGYGLALLWYAMNGLWTLKRGIGTLAERLYEECGDCVKLNTPVTKIVIENGRAKGVETQEGFMEADAVICTATSSRTLQIADLPDVLRKPLEMVRYSQCCHVMFALKNRLLPEGWYAVGTNRSLGSPMAGYTDNSVKSPHYAPSKGGVVHCFTYGRHAVELNSMPTDEVVKLLIEDIQRFTPKMPDEPHFTEIFKWDEAVCLSPPGMLAAMNNMKKNDYNVVKDFYLAGEYLYMASFDGAIKSGIDAAKMAAR